MLKTTSASILHELLQPVSSSLSLKHAAQILSP